MVSPGSYTASSIQYSESTDVWIDSKKLRFSAAI